MLDKLKYLYLVLGIAILVLSGSAMWLVTGVMRDSAKLESIPRDTLIGVASRANYELIQLIYGLEEFGDPNSTIEKQEIQNRYDIVWSREATISSGKVGEAFANLKEVPEIIMELSKTLKETEEEILTLKRGETEKAEQIAQKFRILIPKIYRFSVISTNYATEITATLYSRYEKVSYWTLLLIVMICFTGLLVAIIIWNERRALNNLTRHLEERVEERTKDLSIANESLKLEAEERRSLEEKLYQSQKMEVVGQLTGGIAHDFNNLLAIIQGNAELLEDYANEKDKKLVRPILRSARRGEELTSRLLAFSRKQTLKPKTIDLGELVCSMSELLDRSLGETVEVSMDLSEDPWLTNVDTGQLENALLNLAVNARQAMPSGGELLIKIENIHLEKGLLIQSGELEPGDYIQMTVSDNGVGMTDEVKSHAFEPFFTTKEVGKGSGLGLSMVYGFVKQTGGGIDIESKKGIGTSVSMYFPKSSESQKHDTSSTDAGDLPKGNDETILILEDDLDVLKLTYNLLRSLNYNVLLARSTEDALNYLSTREDIALILSDVVLPGGMTGPDFIAANKTVINGAKVLYMSGYPAEATISSKETSEWDSDNILLSKPFQRSELATQVHRMLHPNT
ncbi:ATP-binding protein [Sneathiella limimaris]|uniref:ATP-binding protein n=1 Tax=Sneathiella limimaris TaxID=1964213 RepID=UPI00146A8A16|nr:ATP-binding protein [Sneathiella limimaris]